MTTSPDATQSPAPLRPGFQRRLEEAVAFKDAHGRLPKSGGRTDPAEISLARWIHRQRTRLTRGLLPADERAAIDAALGTWTTNPQAAPRREWSPAEEELAAREDLTAEDIARITGRTLHSVTGRRNQLRYARRPIN